MPDTKRRLVKDSVLGFIVKDFETNTQCCYGRNEKAAKLAFYNGIGRSEYETLHREVLVKNTCSPVILEK